MMPADPIDIDASVAVLRVLANPARLRIILHLLNGEYAVAGLEADLGVRQPNLSQHLGELRDAGLVVTRRESRSVFYRLTDEARHVAAAVIHGFSGGTGQLPPGPVTAQRPGARQAAVFATVEKLR
ncbi:MAG TPA: metalloregulator ArsR/SmtB family transcription factor [Rhodopila sp.]|nr:metalloregulator ArsR/SmtB family transcription factor [Rhodopila sp.]